MTSSKSVSIPLIGIFTMMLFYLLVAGSGFLIPVTSAILAYFVLSPVRRWLSCRGLPNSGIAFGFTALLLLTVATALFFFAQPVSNLLEDLPHLVRNIQRQIGGLTDSPIDAVSEAADALDTMMDTEEPGEKKAVEVEVVEETASKQILFLAPRVLSQLLFAIIFLFFLLSSGDFFLRRLIASIDRVENKTRAMEIVDAIEHRLGRYLGGVTLINAGLGLVVGTAMYFWGVERYMVIGVMAFALNYIPYVGGLFGAVIAGLLAFSQTYNAWLSLGCVGTYLFCTSVEGQLITPALISRRMQLNAPILFLVVAFFAYIWSVIGMIVAVPILIVVKIVCDEIPGLRNFGYFLGEAAQEDSDITEV